MTEFILVVRTVSSFYEFYKHKIPKSYPRQQLASQTWGEKKKIRETIYIRNGQTSVIKQD